LIRIRDPESLWPWIRNGKIRIRDKHPVSATLLLSHLIISWREEKKQVCHGAYGMKLPGNNVDKLWIIVRTVEQVLETGPVQGWEGAAGVGAGQEGETGGQRTPPSYQVGAGQVPLLNQVPHQPSVKKRYFVFDDFLRLSHSVGDPAPDPGPSLF
jgi:hypothetical protein